MIIRSSELSDAPAILSLLLQMGYPQPIEQVQKRINAFHNTPNHHLLVMDQDGVAVGVIAFIFYEHLLKDGCCCHIDTLVVDQKFRSQGVGEALLAHAQKMALEKNCITMELFTLERRRDTGTHRFYAKMGFKDQSEREYTYFTKENQEIRDIN
jgi:GNAT superfamily N-acetyltransferase